MRTTPPDVQPNEWLPLGKAAMVLGIGRSTLLSKAKLGKRCGGIDYKVGHNGRKKFSGKEILRFWYDN